MIKRINCKLMLNFCPERTSKNDISPSGLKGGQAFENNILGNKFTKHYTPESGLIHRFPGFHYKNTFLFTFCNISRI